MEERVFVYGLLLDLADLPAELPEWKLAFDSFATVVPAPGQSVEGGVVWAGWRQLAWFDRVEGVDHANPRDGYYRREQVTLADRQPAWVYVMNERQGYRPSPHYVDRIRREYERLGLDLTKLEDALSS